MKIAGEAVTVPRFAKSTPGSRIALSGSPQDVLSIYINAEGYQVTLVCCATFDYGGFYEGENYLDKAHLMLYAPNGDFLGQSSGGSGLIVNSSTQIGTYTIRAWRETSSVGGLAPSHVSNIRILALGTKR